MDILFAGELNVDLILTGLKRLPEMGREIMAEDYTECLGSSTAICCCAAASLGVKTGFFGLLGRDRYGELVEETFRRYGVDSTPVRREEGLRTGLTVGLSGTADRALVTVFADTIDAFDAEEIPLEAIMPRHLHAGSFFFQPRVTKNLYKVYERARGLGITTSLDAGWDEQGRWHEGLDAILPHTDFFFPNESEAEAITGEKDMALAAKRLCEMGTNAVIKLGAKGCAFRAKGAGETLFFPPYKTQVVDTTGAGDNFNAGFLYAYLRGLPFPDCARYANATGAVSVTRPGGTSCCPTLSEVERTIATGSAIQ